MLPLFVLPARRIGQRLQAITRESYSLNASMNATMTERFNVAGALLVKLFGRPSDEARVVRASGPAGCATSASPRRCTARAFFVALTLVAALAQALVYGLGGYCAMHRPARRPARVVTLALLLTRLYGPLTALSNVRVDVMSALVSFERVFEVLDLAPMIADAAGRGRAARPAPRTIEFDDVRFSLPDGRRGVARLAGGRRRARPAPSRTRCCTASPSAPSRASWSRWSGRPAPARRRSASWCRASTTSAPAPCASAGSTSAT